MSLFWTRLWPVYDTTSDTLFPRVLTIWHFWQKDPCLRLGFHQNVRKSRKWHHSWHHNRHHNWHHCGLPLDLTVPPSWPHCGLTGPLRLVIYRENTVKQGQEWTRTRTTGKHQGSAPDPYPHTPGTTNPRTGTTDYHAGVHTRSHQARHGSPGFFWLQWEPPKYRPV